MEKKLTYKILLNVVLSPDIFKTNSIFIYVNGEHFEKKMLKFNQI